LETLISQIPVEAIISLISVIIGAILGFCGIWVLESLKKKRIREDFKESILTELKEVLPDLIYITIYISPTIELKRWGKTLLSKLKDISPDERRKQLTNWINDIYELEKNDVIPSPLYLSLLNENILSLSLLNKKLRSSIIRIRYNINVINTQAKYCLSYSQTDRENRKVIINNNLNEIARHSGNTAELIKEIIFE
jgi:hypothetical protein